MREHLCGLQFNWSENGWDSTMVEIKSNKNQMVKWDVACAAYFHFCFVFPFFEVTSIPGMWNSIAEFVADRTWSSKWLRCRYILFRFSCFFLRYSAGCLCVGSETNKYVRQMKNSRMPISPSQGNTRKDEFRWTFFHRKRHFSNKREYVFRNILLQLHTCILCLCVYTLQTTLCSRVVFNH